MSGSVHGMKPTIFQRKIVLPRKKTGESLICAHRMYNRDSAIYFLSKGIVYNAFSFFSSSGIAPLFFLTFFPLKTLSISSRDLFIVSGTKKQA